MAGERQILGEQVPLSSAPNAAGPNASFSGGQTQVIGEQVPLSMTPTSQVTKPFSGGQEQIIGEGVPLSPTPIKGFDSAATPMSPRSIAQSK